MAIFTYYYGSEHGEPIHTYEQWETAFRVHDSKKDVDHWKIGFSAQSLAEDFMCFDGELMLQQMIEQFTGEHIEGTPIAMIEHGSPFDTYKRPRMQDLAVKGKLTNGKSFFIGVEAKVHEPFGSMTLKNQYAYVSEKEKKGEKTNAGKRLRGLIKDFLGHDDFSELTPNEQDIRYQLLYYLAGSFREDGDYVFMPVVAYHQQFKETDNYKAYNAFIDALGGFSKQSIFIQGKEVIGYVKNISIQEKDGTSLTKTIYTCYITK